MNQQQADISPKGQHDQSLEHNNDQNTQKSSLKDERAYLIQPYIQALIIFTICMIAYFLTSILLMDNHSSYWVWSLYLSPIYLVHLVAISCIFIYILHDYRNENLTLDNQRKEENFCILIGLAPIIFIWVPIFIIIYFGVFENIIEIQQNLIIPKNEIYGELLFNETLKFGQENYTMMLIKFNENRVGYGCLTSQFEKSLIDSNPLPFKSYKIPEKLLSDDISHAIKLPTWYCAKEQTNLQKLFKQKMYYTQWNEKIELTLESIQNKSQLQLSNNFYLITFTNPPYIHLSFFCALIGVVYELMWICTTMLLCVIIIYCNIVVIDKHIKLQNEYQKIQQQGHFYDAEKEQSSKLEINEIRLPSRRKRLILIIFSFTQWVLILTLLMYLKHIGFSITLIILLFLPGIVLIFVSFLSKIHNSFYYYIYNFTELSIKHIKEGLSSDENNLGEKIMLVFYMILLPFVIILILFCYFVFVLVISQFFFSLKLYLARHFCAKWLGINQNVLEPKIYNKFVNSVLLIDLLWYRIIAFIIFIVLGQKYEQQILICFRVNTNLLLYYSIIIIQAGQIAQFLIYFCFSKSKSQYFTDCFHLIYTPVSQQSAKVQQTQSQQQQVIQDNQINVQM